MDDPKPGPRAVDGTSEVTVFDLPLTAERRAFLRPRLRAFLADMRELDDVVATDIEPAFVPLSEEERHDDAR